VARALAAGAPLLLADEPTGNLDTESADGVFKLLRSFNETERTTMLIITHDPRLADRCDRIVRLVDGRVVSDERGFPAGPCRACGHAPPPTPPVRTPDASTS
jgi:lipoprotein-releasing system ATP-binding protein